MQNIGYIIDKQTGEKIKVLWRKGRKLDKFCFEMNFKMRKTGSNGQHFESEERHLNDDREKLERLKIGEIVGL